MTRLLEVKGLSVAYHKASGEYVDAVRGVDINVSAGEVVAIVGESGSGKSTTALALMRLLPTSARVTADHLLLGGVDLASLTSRQFEDVRGARMSMIFQNPMSSLNPVHTIGKQISEGVIRHSKVNRKVASKRTIELLDSVGLTPADSFIDRYPHQLSGGMRQRVMIAIALSSDPEVLIADEPTTALDVTVQAQVLELLQDLITRFSMGLILVSHDLGVVANYSDRVLVMYGGRVVEQATTTKIFSAPTHPYTEGLLASAEGVGRLRWRDLKVIEGEPLGAVEERPGCPFAPRCELAVERCWGQMPPMDPLPPEGEKHLVACWRRNPRLAQEICMETVS